MKFQFGTATYICKQIGQAGDTDHADSVSRFDFLNGRLRTQSPFRPNQCNNHARRAGTVTPDQIQALVDGGTGGNDVIDNQYSALERGADDLPAFPMSLGFLAIE